MMVTAKKQFTRRRCCHVTIIHHNTTQLTRQCCALGATVHTVVNVVLLAGASVVGGY